MEEVASCAAGILGTSSEVMSLTFCLIFDQGLPFFGP